MLAALQEVFAVLTHVYMPSKQFHYLRACRTTFPCRFYPPNITFHFIAHGNNNDISRLSPWAKANRCQNIPVFLQILSALVHSFPALFEYPATYLIFPHTILPNRPHVSPFHHAGYSVRRTAPHCPALPANEPRSQTTSPRRIQSTAC